MIDMETQSNIIKDTDNVLTVNNADKLNENIVKLTEEEIILFIHNIANSFAKAKAEYIQFMYCETVNLEELLSALNRVRLTQKLYAGSKDIIDSCGVKENSDEYPTLDQATLTIRVKELKAKTNDTLRSIQKAYNESLDIDDDDEYSRVQSELREKRKKFRIYDEMLSGWINVIESCVNISVKPDLSDEVKTAVISTQSNPPIHESTNVSEHKFYSWLLYNARVSENTARQYISSIHTVEKQYRDIFSESASFFGDISAESAKETITKLIQRNEYISANVKRHNSLSAALNKYTQFMGIFVDGLKQPSERRSFLTPVGSDIFAIKTVDFNNPDACTCTKPRSFILMGNKHNIGSWHKLYVEFLTALYSDSNHAEVLRKYIGKTLCGRCIDFADDKLYRYLRKPIKIATGFYAESNIAAAGIIQRIKRLLELCSIDEDQMVIEYITQDNSDETTASDNESVDSDDIESTESYTSDYESSDNASEDDEPETDTNEQQTMQELSETVVADDRINLKLGENSVTAYDYSDALCKICEFVIDRAPFKMARITEQNIRLNGRTAFYRKPIPIEGYNKLSNGLQVIWIKSLPELQTMIKEIQRCCRINDGTITVIC